MSVYEFTVSLKDQTSGPAKSASNAITVLEKALTATQNALVRASATGNIAQYQKLTQQADSYTAALQVQRQEQGADASSSFDLTSALGGIPWKQVGEAALAAVAAFTAAAVGLAAMAIAAVEAKNKITATLSALAGGPAAGSAMLATLDGLTDKLGMTREQLAPLAEQLLAMGVAAKDVAGQLTALATVKAVGVEGGPEEYLAILKKVSGQAKVSSKDLTNLYKTGVSVSDIAQQMGISVKDLQNGLKNGTVNAKDFAAALQKAVTAKGADALKTQSLSLSSIWDNFKESVGELFEGVDTSGFMAALKDLFSIFSQGSESGKALKAGIGGALTAVFNVAAKALPYIKKGIEYVIIASLHAYLFLKKHWEGVKVVLMGAAIVIGVLVAAAVGVLIVGFLLLAAAVIIAAAPFILLGVLLYGIYKGLQFLWGKIKSFATDAGAALSEWANSAIDTAKNFIQGLVDGIKNGAGLVIDAVKNMGKSAMGALKGLLGISSPSKVMMQFGVHTSTGFAQGIDAAAPKVEGAASRMSFKAIGGAGGAANGNAHAGGKGGVGPVTVTIYVEGAGKSAQDITEEMVSLTFEKLALAQGL